MEFFNELGAKISQTGQKTKKMANDLVDVAKCNTRTGELTKEIQDCYEKLGEIYYTVFGAAPQDEMCELCTQVRSKFEELAIIRSELQRLKNIRVCPQCERENPPDASFCSQCSTRLPELLPAQQAEADPSWCFACGAQLAPPAHFCTKCGTKV